MLPIVLDVKNNKIVVVGKGRATSKRIEMLDEAGAKHVDYYETRPADDVYDGAAVVFVADFDPEESSAIAEVVRGKGILLNVEDQKPYCDFFVPSLVRRGDLIIAVSTCGASPRLAVILKEFFAEEFGPEWENNLQVIRMEREKWLAEGDTYPDLIAKSDALFEELGIFASDEFEDEE
jgi:precorrin-2 dehydrogenase/sirohydrochlorin ferrochelatase